MKVLILVSCVLAVASATHIPLSYSIYPQHIPVIGPHGVPIEPAEVQHARAQHLAAHASARTGGLYPIAPNLGHVYGLPAVPVIGHNALPLDTPEVAAAKAQHYHDYAVAAQRNGVHIAPIAHYSGAPVDTPEVQHAKAQHFAAHAAARAGLHHRKRRGIAYPQHIPVIGPNGVPVDTPEVQAAKAHHYAALAEAGARAAAHPEVPVVHQGLSPYAYAQHVPVIVNGVPVDTPEVQAAKARHYAAYSQALGHGGHQPLVYAGAWSHQPHATIGPDGHPVETPEVQLLKAAHFAAHAHAHGY